MLLASSFGIFIHTHELPYPYPPIYGETRGGVQRETSPDESTPESILRGRECTRGYTMVYTRVHYCIPACILFPSR